MHSIDHHRREPLYPCGDEPSHHAHGENDYGDAGENGASCRTVCLWRFMMSTFQERVGDCRARQSEVPEDVQIHGSLQTRAEQPGRCECARKGEAVGNYEESSEEIPAGESEQCTGAQYRKLCEQ